MPSTYYDLEIGADGALTWAAAPAAPNPIPPEADSFLTNLRAVFNRIRLHIAEGPARTAYSQYALEVGRTGLQGGDLSTAYKELDALNQFGLNVLYYAVNLDENNNFHMKPPPWAPRPMPEDVIVFANRVDRTINKVKRLLKSPEQQRKQSQYLRTLMNYAQLGLAEGDIKSANSGLDLFETQFVEDEGPVFRSKYVTSTLWTAIYTFASTSVLGIGYAATSAYWPNYADFFKVDDNFIPTVLSVVIGVCLGISFFAFVRNLNLTFDSLGHFDPANLSPVLRFALVGIIALILCIVLKAGLIKIEVAGLKLDEFMDADHRLTAVILGMVCGYSDAAITRTLSGVLEQKV